MADGRPRCRYRPGGARGRHGARSPAGTRGRRSRRAQRGALRRDVGRGGDSANRRGVAGGLAALDRYGGSLAVGVPMAEPSLQHRVDRLVESQKSDSGRRGIGSRPRGGATAVARISAKIFPTPPRFSPPITHSLRYDGEQFSLTTEPVIFTRVRPGDTLLRKSRLKQELRPATNRIRKHPLKALCRCRRRRVSRKSLERGRNSCGDCCYGRS